MSSESQNPTKIQKYILGNEILLYQNPDNVNPIWYYRFKNPTGSTQYIRKSAKTQSEALASKRAIEHYNDIQARKRAGSDFAEPTWGIIFERFISKVDGERSRELCNQYNNRYWKVFFGNSKKTHLKDFFNISDVTLEEYWAWRVKFYSFETHATPRKYDGTLPRIAGKVKGKSSHATLRTEAYLLKFFLYEAYRLNMISMMPKVIMKWDKYSSSVYSLPSNNRRGKFDDETYEIVRKWWRKTRIDLSNSRDKKFQTTNESKDWKRSKDDRQIYNMKTHRYSVAMIYTLTITISNTGVRPVEITKLVWDDIRKFDDDDGNVYSYINIRSEVSKTNKRRDAVSRDFEETYKRFQEWKYEWIRYWGREPKDNELVFPHLRADNEKLQFQFFKESKVKPHQSMRNLLLKLSKESGIDVYKQDVNGIKVPRTLYSFRSRFIEKRLENGMDAYTLARNCGTSIEMIERYYDVNANLRFRKEITKHLRNFELAGDKDSQL